MPRTRRGRRLRIPNLLDYLKQAGFQGESLRQAWAIAQRESGGRPDAFNGNAGTGDQSYGLFQINMLGGLGPARRKQYGLKSNADLLDPATNARVAYQMSKGGTDFGAWAIGPNAYKGAPADAVQRYQSWYDKFPGAAQQVDNMASGVASNIALQSKNRIDPLAVGNFAGGSVQLAANQDALVKSQRLNAALQAAAPSDTTQSILQSLGGTAAKTASRIADMPVPLPKPIAVLGKGVTLAVDHDQPPAPGVAPIVAEAKKWLGTPYSFGAGDNSGPTVGKTGKGFDCSGFAKYLYAKEYGVNLPHFAASQMKMGKPVDQQDLAPGDLVFFNKGEHEGIYLGNGQFIHAPHTGDVVKISNLSDPYYQQHFAGGRRIVGVQS